MKKIISLLTLILTVTSCEKVETIKSVDNDFMHNFDYAWNLIHERYCFLDYKKIDWNEVYNQMKPRVEKAKDEFEFFDIMSDLIDICHDGHMSIISNFDKHGSNYKVDANGESYPKDYYSDFISNYVTPLRETANGFAFGHIEQNGNKFAYFHYPSFSKSIENEDMFYISQCVESAQGIILDIRNNPGGAGNLGYILAQHFFSESALVGHFAIKTGFGYNDFSELSEIHITPAELHNWSHMPTMLLTNRSVYSTANLVASILKHAPNVTQVGSITGGGGGMPCDYYLPNGWLLVLPSNILLDSNKEHIENGITPDVEVHISREDEINKKDTILEKAIELLTKQVK